MSGTASNILFTIIGAVVASIIMLIIKSYLNRRVLHLVVPKLFSYSELSSSGNVIELTTINRGRRTEEDIQIELSPKFGYEVIASTLPSLQLSKGVISIKRIPKKEDVSIVLSVDGGSFTDEDVIAIHSKTTSGSIKKHIEQADPGPIETAFIVFAIFIVPGFIGYFLGNLVVDEVYPRYIKQNLSDGQEEKLEAQGWRDIDLIAASDLTQMNNKNWPITISGPKIQKGSASFEFMFKNSTKDYLKVSYSCDSASESKKDEYLESNKRYLNDYHSEIIVLPQNESKNTVECYYNENIDSMLMFDVFIKHRDDVMKAEYIWRPKVEGI